jgi:CheY-like chemotaxis protein
MGISQKILELISQKIPPAEIRSIVNWRSISEKEKDELLQLADNLQTRPEGYDLLTTLFQITQNNDYPYLLKILDLLLRRSSLSYLETHKLLDNMLQILDRIWASYTYILNGVLPVREFQKWEVIYYLHLAQVERKEEQPEEALQHYHQALESCRRINQTELTGIIFNTIDEIKKENGFEEKQRLMAEIKANIASLQTEEEKIQAVMSQHQQLESLLMNKQREYDQLIIDCQTRQSQIIELDRIIQEKSLEDNPSLKEFQNRINLLIISEQQIRPVVTDLKQEETALNQALTTASQEKIALINQVDTLKVEIDALLDTEQKLNKSIKQKAKKTSQLKELEDRIELLKLDLEALQKQYQTNRQEFGHQEQKHQDILNLVASKLIEKQTLENEISENLLQITSSNERIQDLRNTLEEMAKIHQIKKTELASIEEKCKAVEINYNSLLHESESMQSLLAQKSRQLNELSGIINARIAERTKIEPTKADDRILLPPNIALILEPDSLQRDLINLVLQNLGCEVFVAQDDIDARRFLQQRKIDLLVIDTMLPKLSGLDLLKSLRTSHLLDETKIIVISALGFEEVIRQVAQLGVSACLIKPVDVQSLRERVQALLTVKTSSASTSK